MGSHPVSRASRYRTELTEMGSDPVSRAHGTEVESPRPCKLVRVASFTPQMLTCSACGGLTPRDLARATCLHCDVPLRAPRWARRLSRLLGPAGAILLAACYGAPGRYYAREGIVPIDSDGDGVPGSYRCDRYYAGEDCRPDPNVELDCDDADPQRYPGAADPDGDGIDQNCDGVDGWRDPATMAVDPAAPPPASPPATIATDPEP
jgi:hypothetical protein